MPPRQKEIKSVTKKDELTLPCEWGQCEFISNDMMEFQLHVTVHLKSLDPEGEFEGNGCLSSNAMDINLEFPCQWRDCGSELPFRSFFEILRHVYFHALHMKLKSVGSTLIEKNNLKGCMIGNSSRNYVPELGDAFQCGWSDCQAEYDNPHMFYLHVENHIECLPAGNNVPGGCRCEWQGCDTVVKSKHRLREHIRSHTQEKLVACPTCGSLFSNATKFIDHIKRQLDSEVSSYECSHCNNRYGTERLLRDHMRHHVSQYKCPLCDMTCPHPATLRTHIQYRHSQDRFYPCPQCDFGAKTVADLRSHMAVHTDTWITCVAEDCKFRCRREAQMRHHYKKEHTEGDPAKYVCHLCGQRYFRGTRLTRHLKKKHNFKWPAGHNRFRYKQHDDGLYRLQTIRYESIELTEELLRSKSQETEAAASSQNVPGDSEKTLTAHDYSYNLEMLGKVAAALQLPENEKQRIGQLTAEQGTAQQQTVKPGTAQQQIAEDTESLGTIEEESEYVSDAESDMTTSTMYSDVTSLTVYSREEENIDPKGKNKIKMRYPRVPRKRMQSVENEVTDIEPATKRARHFDEDLSNSSMDSYASARLNTEQAQEKRPVEYDSELQLLQTQYSDLESGADTPKLTVDEEAQNSDPVTSTPHSSHTTWYLQPGTHNIVVHSDVPVEFAGVVNMEDEEVSALPKSNLVTSQEAMDNSTEEQSSSQLAQELLVTASELGITITTNI